MSASGIIQAVFAGMKVAAILARGQLEQVGNVGGMQRLGKAIGLFPVAAFDRIEHQPNEVGFEAIIFVERFFCGFDKGESRIGFGSHRSPFAADCCDRAPPTPARRKCNLLLGRQAYCGGQDSHKRIPSKWPIP